MRSFFLLLIGFFLLANDLSAQRRVASRRSNKIKIIGDTSKVFYTYLSNPSKVLRVDSSLYEFEDINPTWRKEEWYSDLGVLASPSFDLVYQPTIKSGFRVGLDQFSRYQLKREDIKYYRIRDNRPFTDLYYSQLNQQNNFIRAEFAHKFNDNVYFALHYNLSNQAGFFTHQRVRNQNVGATMRFFTNNKRYHAYFNVFTNAIKHENNGGILQDTLVGVLETLLRRVPARTGTGETRYNLTEVSYTHFLYNNKTDSVGAKTAATNELSHRLTYQFNGYKYYDTQPLTDSTWYGLANVNTRGIRSFIRHQLLENEISFRQALGGNLLSAPLWVKAYVRHGWNIVYQEPVSFNVHNISIGGIVQNNPQFKFKYRVQGQVTWAERQLDFFVNGHVGYDAGKLGYLEGRVLFQRYQPRLIDRQLYVSWEQIWNNDLAFPQIQELTFGGSYKFGLQKKLWGMDIKAELLNHTLTNWLYYDSIGVQQATESANILQLKAQGNFKVWKIHLDNQIVWQPTFAGESFFRVPQFLFKHNLYIQSYIFKKAMLAKFGVLFAYQTPYKANAYQPLTGAFYVQNSLSVVVEPRIDAYLSFRVWQFRFFIRAENILYFVNERNYFTAYRHPVPNFVVRLGISWRLFD